MLRDVIEDLAELGQVRPQIIKDALRGKEKGARVPQVVATGQVLLGARQVWLFYERCGAVYGGAGVVAAGGLAAGGQAYVAKAGLGLRGSDA